MLREVLSLAREHDVLAYHVYDSRKTEGNGFPDLVLAGRRSLLFAELKSDSGNLTAEQHEWRYRILASGNHHAIWRPKDLDHARTVIASV